MEKLNEKQKIQEKIYSFPYHYLVSFEKENFTQTKSLFWGYEYNSYIRLVLINLEKFEFNSLLDVGCGDGKLLFELSKKYLDKKFVGIDYSKKATQFAKAFNPELNIVCGDITDKSIFQEKFDIVTLIETLEHIPPEKIQNFLKGIHNCLVEGGILLITVPSKNLKLNPKHFQHFDLKLLREYLTKYFSITDYSFINKNSRYEKLILPLLVNRLFILNQRRILNFIYKKYEKKLLFANEKSGKRIFILCKKI